MNRLERIRMNREDIKEFHDAMDRLKTARVRIGDIFRWDSSRVHEYMCIQGDCRNSLQRDMSIVASALVDSCQGDTHTALLIVEIIRKCNVDR